MKPRIMRASSRPTSKAEAKNFVGTVLSDPVWAPEGPSKLRASRVSLEDIFLQATTQEPVEAAATEKAIAGGER